MTTELGAGLLGTDRCCADSFVESGVGGRRDRAISGLHLLCDRHARGTRPPGAFTTSSWSEQSLAVEVESEFRRVRAQPNRLDLALTFPGDPRLDELRREDIAFEQEGIVDLECRERLLE
jgi:hypothetical protein